MELSKFRLILKTALYFLLSFGITEPLLAQKFKMPSGAEKGCPEVLNKKAIKYFEEGTDKGNDKRKRVEALKKAIELQPNYAEALYALSEEYIKTARADGSSFKPAEKYLELQVESCPEYYAYAYFWLGQIKFGNKEYTKAHFHFEKFLNYPDEIRSDEDYNLAKNYSKDAKKMADIFEHPKPFDPYTVNGVSSVDDEYLAVISPDNELMLYTRRMPEGKEVAIKDGLADMSDKLVERFTYSKRKEEDFDSGRSFASPFNKGDNYGGSSMTTDNKKMFITVCKPQAILRNGRSYNYTNCDIYQTELVNGIWSELINLGPNVNTEDGWEAQPSISSDGRILYFASIRMSKDTIGGMDIYRSLKQSNGEWGPAENLGPEINTKGNEKSPFVHSDSETLYFSSDGHYGVGGYDIFFAKSDETGKWKKPKNIGYPINSENDEVGFFVSIDGKVGYFASNSITGKGKGGYDIFAFDLYKEARPESVVLLKGNLKDENGKVPSDAKVEIKNSLTKETTQVDVDKNDGEFVAIVKVKKEEDLVMTVKKEGAAFSSELIKTKNHNPRKAPEKVKLEVKNIELGKTYKINNINYATNSAELTEDSKFVLDEFAQFLKTNSSINVAIHGHTDNIGKDADNLALSTDRAFSVMGYLQDSGVAGKRLEFKGFGPTKPLVENNSEENRAKNRRTEFVILSK